MKILNSCLVSLVILCMFSAIAFSSDLQTRMDQLSLLEEKQNTQIQVSWDEKVNLPIMVSGKLTNHDYLAQYGNASNATFAFFQENEGLLGLANPSLELKPVKEKMDSQGMLHVKYQQYNNGLKVKGKQLWVHFNDGQLETINGRWLPTFDKSNVPVVDQAAAATIAKQYIASSNECTVTAAELIYYPVDDDVTLAWEISLTSTDRPNMEIVIDANRGQVLIFDDGIRVDSNSNLGLESRALPGKGAGPELFDTIITPQNGLVDEAKDDKGPQSVLQAEIPKQQQLDVTSDDPEVQAILESNSKSDGTAKISPDHILIDQNEQGQSDKDNASVAGFRNDKTNFENIEQNSASGVEIRKTDQSQPDNKSFEQQLDSNSTDPEVQQLLQDKKFDTKHDEYDPDNAETQSSKTDPETFAPELSNLALTQMTLSRVPANMNLDETITLNFAETGGLTISSFEIEYYFSTNQTISASDFYIGNDYVNLSPYATGSESITFQPKDVTGLTPGDYYVGIYCPSDGSYWVTNNPLSVVGGADLDLSTIALSKNPVKMDEDETITVSVSEVGGAAVSNREIEYYLSTNNIVSTSDFYIGHDYVTLSASGSGTEAITFKPEDVSGVAPGTYYVGVIIPDEGESWVRNGTLVIEEAAGGGGDGNLEVSNIALSKNPVKLDESETITVTLNEVDGGAVSNREIRYYLSADNTFETSDFYLGNDDVTLSANGSGTEALTFTPQSVSGLTVGTYYVGIYIPDESEVWVRNGTLVIEDAGGGGGDGNLEISTIALSKNPVKLDESETITVTLNEVDGGAVNNREIRYYLSADNTFETSDFYLGNDDVTLSANGTGTESLSFIPQNISGLGIGTYYVGIYIPDESEVWVRNGTLQITDPTATTGDIDLTAIALSKNPVGMNEDETISVSLVEVGGGDVSGREIQYYLSVNDVISTSDFYIGNDNVTLSAGETGSEHITFQPNSISGLTEGLYYVGIIIPDENEAWIRAGQLQIGAPEDDGDLQVTSIALDKNPVMMNEDETITATVIEAAGFSVNNREIQYYLSTNTTFSTSDFYVDNDFVTLSANGSVTVTTTFMPQDVTDLVPGTYYVGIVIPDENEAWIRAGTLEIGEATDNGGNIQISQIDLSANPVDIEDPETITATINEVDGEALSNKEIRYYLSVDQVFDNADFYVGNDHVTLPANGSGTQDITFTPRSVSGVTAGTYYVIIAVPTENEYWRRNGTLTITGEISDTDGPLTGTGTDLLGNNRTFGIYRYYGSLYMVDASKDMYNGPITNLNDLDNKGVVKTHNALLNNSNAPSASNLTRDPNNDTVLNDNADLRASVSAHCNAGTVYDFYKDRFDRDSWDNSNSSMVSLAHGIPTATNYLPNNAYWNGSEVVYGDGDRYAAALDITAHEFTHAVSGTEAGFIYYFQSGALSESFSDVFAALVDTLDWLIGENLNGGAIRSLEDPELFGQPAHMDDYNDLSADVDNGGVHVNCSIPSKAAHLVAVDLGRVKMGNIWYKALTTYMTETSEFIDCRLACELAAKALYGENSPEYSAVQRAFAAVGIGDDYHESGYTISGNIYYYGNSSTPVQNANVALSGGTSTNMTTSASGLYSFSNLETANYTVTPVKSGDLGNAISALDASKILQYSVGKISLSNDQKLAGDVSGDGTASTYDAALILQYTVGIITQFPAGYQWGFSPQTRQYSSLNADKNDQDFSAFVMGDVSGNWSGEISLAKSSDVETALISATITNSKAGENQIVQNEITLELSESGYALQGEFEIDGATLESLYAMNGETITCKKINDNRIRFALASTEPRERIVLGLDTKFSATDLDQIEIKLVNSMLNDKNVSDTYVENSAMNDILPTQYQLYQNYPNPFNANTIISYDIVENCHVQIKIYNVYGQHVATLFDGNQVAGQHKITWNGRNNNGIDLPSGVYLVNMKAANFVQRKSVILLK